MIKVFLKCLHIQSPTLHHVLTQPIMSYFFLTKSSAISPRAPKIQHFSKVLNYYLQKFYLSHWHPMCKLNLQFSFFDHIACDWKISSFRSKTVRSVWQIDVWHPNKSPLQEESQTWCYYFEIFPSISRDLAISHSVDHVINRQCCAQSSLTKCNASSRYSWVSSYKSFAL